MFAILGILARSRFRLVTGPRHERLLRVQGRERTISRHSSYGQPMSPLRKDGSSSVRAPVLGVQPRELHRDDDVTQAGAEDPTDSRSDRAGLRGALGIELIHMTQHEPIDGERR